MEEHVNRWQKARITQALGQRRIVLLAGARQSGKTTLAQDLQTSDVEYRTLDDRAMREAAEADPQDFVVHTRHTLIIDEVQRVPELLPAIKMVVDRNNEAGQYLLTGSANLNAIPSVRESLAGRITKVRLRPFCQGEIAGVRPGFLENAFTDQLPATIDNHDRTTLLERGFRGGYPEAVALPHQQRKGWYIDYVTALLDRDLRDVARIHRMDAMRKLMEVLAAWSSKYMDIAGITSKLSIKRPTVETYINALEALYLVERVPAWTKTDYQRVGTKDKLFMTDCGLMSAILDWHMDQVRFDADRSGKLAETLAFNELMAHVDNDGNYKLYHYRDWEQREVDFLIERLTDRALVGIEIKAGSSVGKNDFKQLKWFQDNLVKDRSFTGIVLYAGSQTLSFGKGLKAVPFGALWS